MPPKGRLPPHVIADFEQWIKQGAADPREGSGAPPIAAPSSIDFEAGRQFWSFQPPRPHLPPPVIHPTWLKQPSDAFVLNRLDAAGLAPGASAHKGTWLRRASLAFIGLSPKPAEIA